MIQRKMERVGLEDAYDELMEMVVIGGGIDGGRKSFPCVFLKV